MQFIKQLHWWTVPLLALLYWLLMGHRVVPSFFTVGRVRGQHVLITGASQGIGRSLVEEYAKRGAKHIVIASRNRQKLDAVKAVTQQRYPSVAITVIPADLSSERRCQELVRKALRAFGAGGLNTLVLNHITSSRFGTWLGDAKNGPEGHGFLREMFEVNTFSYIWLATAAMEALQVRRGHTVRGLDAPRLFIHRFTLHAIYLACPPFFCPATPAVSPCRRVASSRPPRATSGSSPPSPATSAPRKRPCTPPPSTLCTGFSTRCGSR